MSAPFNGLTPAEAERLAMLAEEAGEIVQAVGKILRHGSGSRPPEGGPTNRQQLYRELGDLIAIIHGMVWEGDLPEIREMTDAADRWEAKLRYTHHQAEAADVEKGVAPAEASGAASFGLAAALAVSAGSLVKDPAK